jgi:hypothetical protein
VNTENFSTNRRQFVRVLALGGAAAALTATPAVAAMPEDEYDGGTP